MCGVICLWYAVALHKTIFLGKGTNYLQQQINRSSLMLTKHNWPSAGVISLASHIQRTHRLMRFCFILQFKYRPIENFFIILNNTFYFVKSAHHCKLRVKRMPAYIQQVQFKVNYKFSEHNSQACLCGITHTHASNVFIYRTSLLSRIWMIQLD